MTRATIAQRLAEFVVGLTFDDLPKSVVEKATQCVLDQMGVQVIGATQPWNRLVAEMVVDDGGRPQSTVVAFGSKVPSHAAAYANATCGQGCELDDYLGLRASAPLKRKGSVSGHAGAVTIPVALALAETRDGGPTSGRELLTAIVAGYEVMACITYPIRDGIHDRGFHLDSAVGLFGSTAAAARLLRLTEAETTHAFAIAGSHASGTMEYDQTGGEVKRLHSGLAARAGVQSAELARRGLTGPSTIFEGKRGVMRAFGEFDGDASEVTEYLGKDFVTGDVGFKVHPVRSGIAGSLDAVTRLTAEEDIRFEDIASVDVEVASQHVVSCGNRRPSDTIGAQMSLPFAVALHLVTGTHELTQFADPAMWVDQRVLGIIDRLQLRGSADFKGAERHTSRVQIRFNDGREIKAEQVYPKGSVNNPLTWGELVGKFRHLTAGLLPTTQVDRTIALVDDIVSLEDAGVLPGQLVQPA